MANELLKLATQGTAFVPRRRSFYRTFSSSKNFETTRIFDGIICRKCSTSPSSNLKSYHLVGSGQKASTKVKTNYGNEVDNQKSHTIETDVPVKMGGGNANPQPVELLLASYIGCTQATAIFVGRNMKPNQLLIDKLEFDIKGERDERGALDNIPIWDGIQNNDASNEIENIPNEFPDVPARLSAIRGTITVYAKNRKGEKVEIGENTLKILEKHTERRCPVANMIIESGCSMDVDWVDGSTKSSTASE